MGTYMTDRVNANRKFHRAAEGGNQRGCLHQPQSGATSTQARVLAVKLDLRELPDAGQPMFKRLRDLSWQSARYRNGHIRRRWAEAMGWRLDGNDKHAVTKQGRAAEKGELSGAAYSAAEREVQGVWTKEAKRVLAGAPLPEWRTDAALSIRGHKHMKDSGVRLEWDGTRFWALLCAQAKECEGGCWLRLPIAKNTKRDEYQGVLLHRMAAWDTPIAKATVQIKAKRRQVILRLTYEVATVLPVMGKRVATLGPIDRDNRLHLRTETQTKDYTSRYVTLLRRKDDWDGIRRRMLRQVGRAKGHARTKKRLLANHDWADWVSTHLHNWTREVVTWCESQGVGTIKVWAIETGDWPADRFRQMLHYKASDRGIKLEAVEAEDKSLGAIVKKQQRKNKRRREAYRDIADAVKKSA